MIALQLAAPSMSERLVGLALGVGVLSFVLVGFVRRLALRHGVVDHPSERSSHVVVTPRGGGLGLLLAMLTVSTWRATHPVDAQALWLIIGTVIIAAVGWVDDRRGLAVRVRLAAHLVAAIAVGTVAASATTPLLMRVLLFTWWTFWTVSSINLVNFMDGINGLVASQIAVFAFSLALFLEPSSAVAVFAVALAAACLGFLPWNFPRARIFLGDVGSGGLGFLVPVLALLAGRASGIDIVRAHLPLLPLYLDATTTIVRRWRDGERLTAAHRSHLYQRLANGGMGHVSVTAIYTAAAMVGAVAAHIGRSAWVSPWIALYAVSTIVVGLSLHRRASRSTPATT